MYWLHLLALAIVMTACGGNAYVPDESDATPSDSDPCQCPPASTLIAERIARDSLVDRRNTLFGDYHSCRPEEYLMGMGCSPSIVDPDLALLGAGFSTDGAGNYFLGCDWYWDNPSLQSANFALTAICLSTDEPMPASPPDGCDCPAVEPLVDRISRVQRTLGLPSQSSVSVAASCPVDSVLVAGGCALEPFAGILIAPYFTLSESGMMGNGWRCSADNAGMEDGFTVTATAVCIRPPAPMTASEAEPLADRVDYVSQEEQVPANSTLGFSTACPPGAYLISGSCTLDSVTPPSNEVALFDLGFDSGDPNAWRCAWSNPTSATPTARVTAICLGP